ncbi:J domain-containing protein [bacterium]|nr:J domain-containing protein [bacterium]
MSERPGPDRAAVGAARVAGALLLVAAALAWLAAPASFLPDAVGWPDPRGLLAAAGEVLVLAIGLRWLRRAGDPPAVVPPESAEERRRARAEVARRRVRESAQEAWEPSWDPHRVLGIDKTATIEEITRAYRDKMKLYDPERVATMREDLQRLAHERVLEIRRAYDELSGGATL